MQRSECGLEGYVLQYTRPHWQPLLAAVGERLTGTFMWMHEGELEDGNTPPRLPDWNPAYADDILHAIERRGHAAYADES